MSGNSFGKVFCITSYGESHGKGIGVVIDGCPAGLKIDLDFVRSELQRRKPGQSVISSPRNESDEFILQSGVLNGISTGAPMAFFVPNTDVRSVDYDHLQDAYRPSHADYTYEMKYGIRDAAGGGRSSARETLARVIAGAIAKLVLKEHNIYISAFVSSVGTIRLDKSYQQVDLRLTEENMVRCPDAEVASKMIQAIENAKIEGDSLGGIITCVVVGTPVGLGAPVYDRLEADLAKAMLSINATKGFEIGSGFAGSQMKGSEHNDVFENDEGKILTKTNFSGGVQGGISNGMDIYFNVAFKPTSTIAKEQRSIDRSGNEITLKVDGRHDPCVVPRAVPIVEAMAALVLVDHLLRNKTSKI